MLRGIGVCLVLGGGETLLADDVELHAVSHYLAGNVCAYRPQEPLDGRVSELVHRPACDAYSVVVVFDACQAVLRRAVWQGQLANDTCIEQELDCSVHCSPTYAWKLAADFLRAEALIFAVKKLDDAAARLCHSVSPVFQDSQQIRSRLFSVNHDT